MSQEFLLCESVLRVNGTVPVAPTELEDESWCVFCDLYVFREGWANSVV